ncbi:hypothetical protein [Halomarina rubra]|uniref:Uncharacterized protein n=1 Tax=Halomarina rubra TaxID=2071873 RepID=A0ABD6ASZ7_9EURY|nr:hypothetical protein [Halomarina rubra]
MYLPLVVAAVGLGVLSGGLVFVHASHRRTAPARWALAVGSVVALAVVAADALFGPARRLLATGDVVAVTPWARLITVLGSGVLVAVAAVVGYPVLSAGTAGDAVTQRG